MFAASALVLALLLFADLWDVFHPAKAQHAGPGNDRDGSRLRWPAVVFAAGVIIVFLALELAGNFLLPGPLQILDTARRAANRELGSVDAARPTVAVSLLLSVVLFYVAGFFDYVVHRWFSHSRWFWYTHEYHHLPRFVSVLAPGILGRPFAFIPGALAMTATAATVYAGLALCGLPAWNLSHLVPVLLVIVIVLTASHSSFLRRFAIVHTLMKLLFLTSPHEHVLHHAANLQGNFGNFTTLWDRLFGTYLDPRHIGEGYLPLGLPYDQDFLGTLTLGRFKLSPRVRERFEISRFCNLDEGRKLP
jgi:sterol desaturase/sphingolipid hydroxylase (fatty acid hydroxylase superfamily)